MKKTSFLLLALVVLMTALLIAGCEPADVQSEAESKPAESVAESTPEVSEPEVSEPEVSEPEVSEPEIVYAEQKIDLDRTLTKTLISQGCTYTVTNNDPDYGWHDNGTKLTDGVFGDLNGGSNALFDGWSSPSGTGSTVILDLGEKVSGIADIEMALLQNTSWGIGAPQYFAAYVSDDGETWIPVGEAISSLNATVTGDVTVDASWCRYAFSYAFEKGIEGQYIKFEVGCSQFAWTDEACVYVYGE